MFDIESEMRKNKKLLSLVQYVVSVHKRNELVSGRSNRNIRVFPILY